ncbi:hypothetical protein [Undibacterium sp.]|uniref:hypothetical protein n=1 Tax=Undibacterium sp. TaxID=1914977 RepID=UPI00374C9756
MATPIIAGHFELQDEVADAIDSLVAQGYPRDSISAFYANPAGQHSVYPIGGDRDKSPGAKETSEGVVVGASGGAVLGGIVGSAGTPVIGPAAPVLGALVGAHIGSLVGSLNSTKEKNEDEEGGENEEPLRKSGMMVAVALRDEAQEERTVALFKAMSASRIERAHGTIVNGDWQDFDPLSSPVYVDGKVLAAFP